MKRTGGKNILVMKALLKHKHKNILILCVLMFLVLMTTHIAVSLNNTEDETAQRISEVGGAHTSISSNYAVGFDDVLEKLAGVEGLRFEETKGEMIGESWLPLGFGEPGHYSKTKGERLLVEIMGSNTSYTLVEGKSLENLDHNEIAISRALADDYRARGIDPMGHEIQNTYMNYKDLTYDEYFQLEYRQDEVAVVAVPISTFKIVSIFNLVEDGVYDDTLSLGVDFFKDEDLTHRAFVTEESLMAWGETLSTLINTDYERIEKTISEGLSSLYGASFMEKTVFTPLPMRLLIYYDNFSFEKEAQIVDLLGKNPESNFDFSEFDNLYQLHTLNSKLAKDPMAIQLLRVVSKFVLVGVVLSALYAFYIHIKNQLRTSANAIAALLMQGVKWPRIVSAYSVEFVFIALVSLGLFTLVSGVFSLTGMNRSVFAQSSKLIGTSLGVALVFLLVSFALFYHSLSRYRKDVLTLAKTNAKSTSFWVGFDQKYLIRQFSIKRLFSYIQSSLGYALSISIICLMMLISLSASFAIKNVYDATTFGMHFDYIVESSDLDLFYEMQNYAESWAILDKEENVTYMEHDIDRGNSNFYQSSEIVFYNRIEPFVYLQSGEFPKSWSEVYAEDKYGRSEVMVSRRHMDRRDGVIYGDRTNRRGTISRSYLFSKRIGSYEEVANPINGTINTLFNKGWAVYRYLPLDEQPVAMKDTPFKQYILNLKDTADAEAFEEFLNGNDMKYTRFDTLMDGFQQANDKMNAVSLLSLSLVSLLMLILLSISLYGQIVNARFETQSDNRLLSRLGFKKSLVNRIEYATAFLRVIAALVFLALLFVLVVPRFMNDLLSAFGLYSLPVSIFGITLWSLGGVLGVVVLMYLYVSRKATQ